MRQMTIEQFPNREVRLTIVRSPSGRKIDYETNDETEFGCRVVCEPTCHSLKTLNAVKKPRPVAISESQLKPGYGGLPRFQRFSTYGRRTLLRAGGALERAHPHHECAFLTVTHPGSTRESMEVLAKFSAFAVQRLKAWLGKRIQGNLSLYTWEWQKRGALHLHYVVHCPNEQVYQYVQSNLKAQWIRILDAIAKESGVDIYRKHSGFSWASNKDMVRVDCQRCEKSVAAYLSKYLSKATDNVKRMPKNAYCPSRWYGVSRPLLALLREMSVKVTLYSLRERDAWETYQDCLSVLQSYSLKCYEYGHTVGDGKTAVSYFHVNEQQSIWTTLMNMTPQSASSSMNTEQNLRRLARNGTILIKRHLTWLKEFNSYYGRSRPGNLLNLHSFKDLSRSDLIFILDALAYSFRSHQRTRFELPGECKLWYSTTKLCLENATSEELEWIGAFRM